MYYAQTDVAQPSLPVLSRVCSKRCPSAEFGHFLASYLARDFSFVLADRGPTEGGREGGQIAVVTDRRRIVSRYVGQTLPCCARHLRERERGTCSADEWREGMHHKQETHLR